jgi:hypothetical protein
LRNYNGIDWLTALFEEEGVEAGVGDSVRNSAEHKEK